MSGSVNVLVGLFIVPPAEFYFFSSDSLNCAASLIVRVRYYTNQIVLNALWNSYWNKATKNVYRYLYFPNFLIPKEIPWWKLSKQKRNPFIISVTSTLPSPSKPRLGPGLGSDIIVCVVTSAEREEKDLRRTGTYQSYNFLTRLGMQSL